MIVLGIDPGIGRMGWAIVRRQNTEVRSQNFGCLETSSQKKPEERLVEIYRFISDLVEKHKPSVLAIEELFFNNNAKTAFLVGQARGVVILAAAQKKIPVFIYTPLQVKVAVTGFGRAEKAQVGKMVKTILKLKEVPKPDDTTDALAVALCHVCYNRRVL